MFSQPQQLTFLSLKGYRELLRRLRQQSHEEASTSAAAFQQAKQLALAHLRTKHGKEKLNPRRAFTRLRQRLTEAKQDLKQLKVEKAERLRAQYAALKDVRLGKREHGRAEVAVLGRDGITRTLVLGMVGVLSKTFMSLFSNTRISNPEALHAAFNRPAGQGLVTVSNHVAALDDPLVVAALMPTGSLLQPQAYRWGMCATDRCFKNEAMGAFFRAGKTLPVVRGAGLQQAGMQAAEARLDAGDWVHIFPEGTRSRSGLMGPLRKGIGHLVIGCSNAPMVLPFVHSGMEKVLPPGSKLPHVGQQIRVLVGQPISFEDIYSQAVVQEWNSDQVSVAITQRVADTLYSLKAELEGVPLAEVVRPGVAVAPAVDSDALMPLIEEQIDGLRHSWLSRRQGMHNATAMPQQLIPDMPEADEQMAAVTMEADATVQKLRLLRGAILEGIPGAGGMQGALEAVREYFSTRSAAMHGLAMA